MYINNLLNYFLAIIAFFIIGKSLINPFLSKYKNRVVSPSNLRGKRFGLHVVELVRLLTFVKLFACSLSIVFLSQYMLQITIASKMPASLASLLYVFYQIIFVLMIIPGGYIVEARRLKFLLLIVIVLEALMYFGFGIATSFWEILLLQIAFGILVPISSSTEYAYIFRFSSGKTRGKAIAIYSNTLRGAVIAGTFCGGWLVSHFGMQKVFFLAAALNLLSMIYTWIFIPSIKPKYDIQIKNIEGRNFNFKYVLHKLPSMLREISFLKTVLFIGLGLGLLEDGVVLFGLPLLFGKHNISHQVAGQLLSLFAIDFFIANEYVTKLANKTNKEDIFLFLGLCGIAVSLIFICGLSGPSVGSIMFVGVGLLLLGIFRSFIVSPAINYVTKNPVSHVIGRNVTLSVYKLFQTLGRIIGPIIIMQLFLFTNFASWIYCLISVLYLIMAVLFRYGFSWRRCPKCR